MLSGIGLGGANTTVNFVSATSSIGEDGGTVDLTLSITNPSTTNATSVDVVLLSGDAARIGGYTTQTVTWPANDATSKTVTITLTDNALCDGDEDLVFGLDNVDGGDDAEIGATDTHTLTVVDDDGSSIDAPVATAATDVLSNGFTATWEAVPGATGYYLDVYSGGGPGGMLVEWTFPTSGTEVNASGGIPANLGSEISTEGGTGAITDVAGATTQAASAAGWDGGANTKYWQVDFTTAGYAGITVSSKQRSSNTGPRDFKLQYRVGAGAWTDVAGADITVANDFNAGVLNDVALPAECDDQPQVFLRWIMTSNTAVSTNPVQNGGTSRIDDIIVNASSGGVLYVLENEPVGNVLTYPVTGLDPGVTYYYVVRAANACVTSDDSNVQEVTTTVPSTTSVAFATASSSAGEADGTVSLVLSITNPSTTNATSVDVVLLSGDGTRIDNFTAETVTWPANDATSKTVTITLTDNALCDGDEDLVFGLDNVDGGDDAEIGATDTHTLTVVDDDGSSIDAPVATAATAIGDNGFTATWEAVPGATGYHLDVYTLEAGLATDLFISEYLEGTSNNKYIEIYNGTGAPVNLGNYELRVYANGGTTTPNIITLNNVSLAHDAVYVVGHSSATLVTADQTSGALSFNGNDAVELYNTATNSTVDIFGHIGENPGTAWTSGDHSTLDMTLRRKSTVYSGVTVNPGGSGFPTLESEWDAYPTDNVDDLGSHTFAGGPSMVSYVVGYTDLSVGNVLTYPVTGLDPGVTYYYVVRAANACATSDDSNVQEVTTTVPVAPTLTADPDALDFGSVQMATTATLAFELSGVDLDPDAGAIGLEVEPGLEVEISLDEIDWDTYLEVEYSDGELAATTIHVRFSPTAPGLQQGEIAISGGDASTSVAISGTGTAPVPELIAYPEDLNFSHVLVDGSAVLPLAISGLHLDPEFGALGVEVSAGLEVLVSLDQDTWDTYLELPYSDGEVEATIYAMFTPTTLGVHNGLITIAGGDAEVVVPVSGIGNAAQLYWDFQTEYPTVSLIPFLSSSPLGRGQDNSTTDALVNSTSASTGYPGASGTNNACVSAVPGVFNAGSSTYFDFTVHNEENYFTLIHTIRFGTRSTNTGPQAYRIRWSLDNYATDLASGTLNNNSTWVLKEHTGLELLTPPGGTVTFRIYGHSGSALSTSPNWRIDDLDLRGDSYEAAEVYYSRATGNVGDMIWSPEPDGTAGPASFGPGVSMVVQDGDVVTATASVTVHNVEVETGATLELNSGTTFSIHGDAVLDGDVVANESEIALVGADGVILQSANPLDLYDLTVNTPNGALTDAVIAIRGTLQLTDGEFESAEPITLVSDANGTARLGPVGATADLVGELTVQRWIPDGATNWRLLGSPVAGQTVNNWKDDFFTAGFPGSHFPEFYDTPNGGYQPGASLWPSIRWYDETVDSDAAAAGMLGVTSSNMPLAFGQGFAAWSGDSDQGTVGFTVDVTGVPHIAKTPAALPVSWTELSPAAPAAQGWNLVANPLPSPIAFSELTRGADVANGYYVYDPATGNNAYWDGTTHTSTPAGALNGIIQSSQAFWVKANGPDATLTVSEAAKVSDQTGGLFGGSELPTAGQLRLVIAHAANTHTDEARVFFGLGTPGFDADDALKLPVGHQAAPRIATRSAEGYDMMVNKYGAYTSAISLPVTVRAAITGTHTITVHTAAPGLSCFTLEDLLTGAMIPVNDGATYSFEQESTGNNAIVRFMLHATAPVPVLAEDGLCGPLSGRVELLLGADIAEVALSHEGALLAQLPAATGHVVFDELATGIYTISVSGITACGHLTADLAIANSGEPVVLALDVPATAPVATEVELHATATEGAVVLWDLGDGHTAFGPSVSHTYAAPGTYTVTATATIDGCAVTSTTTVTVEVSTGVSATAATPLRVYHSGDHFVVEHAYNTGGTLRIEVLDATGRLVITTHTAARPGRALVPSTGLSSGVWFVRLRTDDDQRTVRVPLAR